MMKWLPSSALPHTAEGLGCNLPVFDTVMHFSSLKSACRMSRQGSPVVSTSVYLGIWPRKWAASHLRCMQSISQNSVSQGVSQLSNLMKCLHFSVTPQV